MDGKEVWYITANVFNKFPIPLGEQPTVDCLDASAVVIWELEIFRVKPLVEGGHDGRGVVGVLQTQSMTQLMDGHQENIITFRKRENYNLVSFHFFQDLHFIVYSPSTYPLGRRSQWSRAQQGQSACLPRCRFQGSRRGPGSRPRRQTACCRHGNPLQRTA